MSKKILIVIPRMGGGGAERVVSIVANHLAQKDYTVRIFTLVSAESFYPLHERVQLQSALFAVDRSSPLRRMLCLARNFAGAVVQVRRQIREFAPDIVFSVLEEADIVTYLARLGCRRGKWLVSERNDPTRRSRPYRMLLHGIYTRADGLVCQSRTVSDFYFRVRTDRKCVIPNPIDPAVYPEKVPESTPCRIAAVGRLRPQKNMPLLVEAFSKVADKYPETTLTIYGDGPDREKIAALAAQLGIGERVQLPGAVRNVLEQIRSCAVFVMSSDYEGFPNALMEAVTMGVPVISTDFATGVAREWIGADNGLVVPCGSVDAMAAALDTLLGNPKLRQHIRAVTSRTTQPLAVEKIVTLWEELFHKLSGRESPNGLS